MSLPPVPGPWHREPWVWLLVAIPLSSVLMGIVLIVLAVRSDDGLVTDDYYRRGMEINRVLARDDAAARLGLRARVDLGPDTIEVLLETSAGGRVPGPAGGDEALVLRFAHPTRAGLDHEVVLAPVGGGRYVGAGLTLAPGRWHVQVENDTWRLAGRLLAGRLHETVELTAAGR